MKLKYMIWIGFSLLSFNAYALSGKMTVQILNNTDTTCHLIQPQLLHGNNMPVIDDTLTPQESTTFTVSQDWFYGPDILVGYTCGENKIVNFEVQQNFTSFYSQQPTMTIKQIMGLSLASQVFEHLSGIINITINKAAA